MLFCENVFEHSSALKTFFILLKLWVFKNAQILGKKEALLLNQFRAKIAHKYITATLFLKSFTRVFNFLKLLNYANF